MLPSPNHRMNTGTQASEGIGISALTSGMKKFSIGLKRAHQDAERQADRDRKAHAHQHPIERGGGVRDHGAVDQRADERVARSWASVGISAGGK